MRRRRRKGKGGPPDLCICPNCGHKEQHQLGIPCSSKRCPECGSRMIARWE